MNNIDDLYYTIVETQRSEIKVKGSRFIASASPSPTKESALDFLNQIRSEFHDATHNCFAYRIGPEGMEFRAADDGEPSGSAGKPILFAISKYGISDVVVVATRYFGGTKLGVGGLARAYSGAAEEVLKICKKKPVHITTPVKVFCTYEDISPIKKLVDEMAVKFYEEYRDAIEIIAEIPKSKVDKFVNSVTNLTSGRAGTIIQK